MFCGCKYPRERGADWSWETAGRDRTAAAGERTARFIVIILTGLIHGPLHFTGSTADIKQQMPGDRGGIQRDVVKWFSVMVNTEWLLSTWRSAPIGSCCCIHILRFMMKITGFDFSLFSPFYCLFACAPTASDTTHHTQGKLLQVFQITVFEILSIYLNYLFKYLLFSIYKLPKPHYL